MFIFRYLILSDAIARCLVFNDLFNLLAESRGFAILGNPVRR